MASRPEWLPESDWDTTTNSIKPEFGTRYAAETATRAALAARKPEDIKFEVKLPEGVKAPDGMDLKINDKDPRVPVLREMAIKRGWDQSTVDDLVAFDAQQQIAAHNADVARMAEEEKAMGSNAKARFQAAANYNKGLLDRGEITPAMYERARAYATDALTVQYLEVLIAKANGSVPGSGGSNEPPKPEEVPMAKRWYAPQKAS